MRKVSVPVDVGVALQGRLNEKGDYGYNLMIANGSGAKFETDKFKKFYGNVYAKFMGQKIIIDAYADFERANLATGKHKEKSTIKGFVAYQSEEITVGVEAFQQFNKNGVIDSVVASTVDTTDGIVFGGSVFARGRIFKDKLGFFARYDLYDSDTRFNADYIYVGSYAYYKESFMTFGLDYTPVKNIHIMPNVWYNAYQDKRSSKTGLAKNDYDMAARLTVYYVFK